MLQLDGMRSRFRENVAHRVRRYRKMDVASGPVPDVTVVIPDIAHIARTNNKPIRLRRISAFLPPASWGVSSGEFLRIIIQEGLIVKGIAGSSHEDRAFLRLSHCVSL